jgi:hypothetical protein
MYVVICRVDSIIIEIAKNCGTSDILHRKIGLGIKAPQLPCRVLFTTRQRFDANGLSPFEVAMFSPEASRIVLTHYRPDLTDDATVDEVCSAPGYLPLALELGAIFLKKKPKASRRNHYLTDLPAHVSGYQTTAVSEVLCSIAASRRPIP